MQAADNKAPGKVPKKRRRFAWLAHRYWAGVGVLVAIVIGVATMVQAGMLGSHGGPSQATAVGSSPGLSPSPMSSPSPLATVTPSPSPTTSTPASPPPQAQGPSTTANIGDTATMHIVGFYPGPPLTQINIEIDNHSTSNPFTVSFDKSDVTVYDELTPPHVYLVTSVSGNTGTISPGSGGTVGIGVSGEPNPAAKKWIVTFKLISSYQNITVTYALVS